ncbi:MAG: alpha-N-acetylglucosaminidase TIM-barrel domain-containing protein [Prevotella sp.]|nr:alpha-N-acetylglucosaminidase TIM-barrel domain-containing protein [Prevotella sp.]
MTHHLFTSQPKGFSRQRLELSLLFIFLSFLPSFATTPSQDGLREATGIINRFTGGTYTPVLRLSLPLTVEGHDQYIITSENGRLAIDASSPVALCHAFYSWTRHCGAGIMTWSGHRFDANRMRLPSAPITVVSPYRDHQYFNVVTFGYTTPFWSQERWDEEVDWMALHGIDMPLALNGQEAVQRIVFQKMGLTMNEIKDWEVGPAHLPWMRMGNISGKSLDGPLDDEWVAQQVKLEKHLLSRYRALGMKPIVPAFSGFVPKAFGDRYGQTTKVGWDWINAKHNLSNYRLDPVNPYFVKVGRLFVETWDSIFGPAHYYLSDSFNEMTVPSDTTVLTAYGDSIYKSITEANPNAVWVMQGWTLGYQRKQWQGGRFEALVKNIPDNRFMLLDMATDYNHLIWKNGWNWEAFPRMAGKEWVWSVIPDMGGRTQYNGVIDYYANGRLEALNSTNRGQLTGYGFAPEGVENNDMVYELLTDGGWTDRAIDVAAWIRSYIQSRYGFSTPEIEAYYKGLLSSTYSRFFGNPTFNWQFRGRTKHGKTQVNAAFLDGLHSLLSLPDSLIATSPLLMSDMAEGVSLSLGQQADSLLNRFAALAANGQKQEARRLIPFLHQRLSDMDAVLQLHPIFNLRLWEAKAMAAAPTSGLRKAYARNARRLLTTWIEYPDNADDPLDDYANRAWCGLIRDYYLPRVENLCHRMLGDKSQPDNVFENGFVNRAPYLSHEAKLPNTPVARVAWMRQLVEMNQDMLLMYAGGNHRDYKWTEGQCAPNVTYVDEKGKEHWLFDSYLFLEIYSGFGADDVEFAKGYKHRPATKEDWKKLADAYLQTDCGVGGLDLAIGTAEARIGATNHRRQVYIGIPQPIAGVHAWGRIHSKDLDFSREADCLEAVKWYVDYVRTKFNNKAYKNVDFGGFYWIAEHDADTKKLIPKVAAYLDSIQCSFVWIPFFGAQGATDWKQLGFSKAFLQPNYFFSEKPIKGRLDVACQLAKQANMGLEVEFDERVKSNEKDCRAGRLRDYLNAFTKHGFKLSGDLAYYMGSHTLNELALSHNRQDRQIYQKFCRFVADRQEKAK